MAREYPRFAFKAALRRIWSAAPPNALLNAVLFTPPMLALAQQIYFQKRALPGQDRTPGAARRFSHAGRSG
jgi:hypothetical protein